MHPRQRSNKCKGPRYEECLDEAGKVMRALKSRAGFGFYSQFKEKLLEGF